MSKIVTLIVVLFLSSVAFAGDRPSTWVQFRDSTIRGAGDQLGREVVRDVYHGVTRSDYYGAPVHQPPRRLCRIVVEPLYDRYGRQVAEQQVWVCQQVD